MEYTSALETLEGFLNALNQVEGWAILYPSVKIRVSQEFLMVVNKAPSSLLVDS